MNEQELELLTVIHSVMTANASEIGHNDRLFLQRIYGEGLNKYVDRLKAIGFTGKEKVLDGGCGFGQWSLALAGMNHTVESCDVSSLRVRFLEKLAYQLGVSNINTTVSGIDLLPYPDNHFDAILCYGVIFLTPWRKSLMELKRVLKPGGQLYVNANGLGWYMFLWQEEHNKADDYDPKAVAAKCLSDTLIYNRNGVYKPGMQLIIEPAELIGFMRSLGFSDIHLGPEGSLHLPSVENLPVSFFRESFGAYTAVFEVLASNSKSNRATFRSNGNL